jgi:uncharacterized protein YecE (DUF72 family)
VSVAGSASESATRQLRIGCSGWNYRHWRNGVFYPPRLPASRWLELYAKRFDTVELNMTFYRLPRREAVERWVAATPERFIFAVKVSRYVTHVRRLQEAGRQLEVLLERIQPLGESGKLGPLLWLLPPTFAREERRLASALAELDTRPDHGLHLPPVPLRLAGASRQLLGIRARGMGAPRPALA